MNFQKKEKAGQGIGIAVNQANSIPKEQENYLGEKGFLGSGNTELLCYTLVWVFGIHFALRAGQEHRNLRLQTRSRRCNLMNQVMNSYSIWRILVKLMVD